MPNNDSHQHVVKTTAQWDERAVEYWVVPRGCLCVELTPEGKTKLKVGEGNKYFKQLPYICDHGDLTNYYTKEEVDNLFDNLNRMAIMSTDVYDSADDLPSNDNKLGDVRFVKSSTTADPDLYAWIGDRWIDVNSSDIDPSDFVTKPEFNAVKDKVDEIYPKAHTHANKDILDGITQADRDKFDDLHNYDDTELRELIARATHVHPNKALLDTITASSLWTTADRTKFDDLHNYDDTEVKVRLVAVEEKAHTHANKTVLDGITQEKLDAIDELAATYVIVTRDISDLKTKSHTHANKDLLDGTTASFTVEQQNELYRLSQISTFIGAGPTWDGVMGYVPAPEMGCQNYFLRGDGTWALIKATGDKYKAGEGIYILSGEVTADSFPFKLYAKGGYVKQYIIYGAPGGVGDYNSTTGRYHIPIEVSAEGHTSITTVVQINDPLYENDWINYETQEYCVTKTNLTNTFQNLIAVSRLSGIDANGDFNNPPGRWPQFALSDYYEIEADAQYELPAMSNYGTDVNFYQYANVNMYDANYNRTRTILRGQYSKVIITPLLGEKYLRIASSVVASDPDYFIDPVLYRLKEVINPVPIPLQQIQLIPNTINTIDVLTTTKPLDVYMETVVPPDPDPDDPMSEYTGIIYNDGILDVTQEDPNALNELTFHYRDNVDKTLTIPSEPLPIASDTTLGGIKVGNNLTIDPVTGVLDATGGNEYVAGDGISFAQASDLPTGYIQLEYVASDGTLSYIDTGVSHGFTAYMDLQYDASNHRQLMGIGLNSGTYFGSNVSEQFEMSGVIANSDTTQRNTAIWHHDEINPCRLEVDGSSVTDGSSTGASNDTFKLFSPFTSSGFGSSVKIYSVDIYDNNNTRIRRLIPCESPQHVVGLYDLVNDLFYAPSGSDLIAGPVRSDFPISINAKLGNGLSFDSNDAITVDEMTGADGTNAGTAGIVPAPGATDNTKFLRGDGTWAIPGSSGGEYVAGDGITFTHPGMTDLGFDFDAFVAKITSMHNGTKTVDSEHEVLTLTATGNDCYTGPYSNTSAQNVYTFPIVAGHVYRLTWDSSNPSVSGRIFAFENVSETNLHWVDQSVQDYLEFTAVTSGTINFRFGVQNSGDTISYSNIHFYEIDNFDPNTTIINADIAKGLEFDSLDKLQVKLGDGLHFDSNDAIEIDSNLYYPGQGIEFGGETLIPTEFNQSAFINVIGASNGNISKTPALDAFTLTATNNDCFTDHYDGWSGYYITAEPNTKYRVSWESTNGTSGNMFVFEVSGTTYTGVMYIVNNANTNVNIFTTSSTCTKLSLRFGVASTGNSERYSNITFDKVVPLNNVITAKLGDGLQFDANGAIEAIGSGTQYVRVNTTDSYVLLHTKPADWDDHWDKYFELTYDEITTAPPDWDPTQHYKYENDNYVLGTAGDTFVSTTWYDKHYVGLDPTTAVTFDSDVYYTGELHLIEDGETYDTAFEKVNEAIEHIERLEQEVQYLQDDRVGVRVTNPSSENLEFYNT